MSVRRPLSHHSALIEVGHFAAAWLVLNVLPLVPAMVTPLPVSPYFPLCVEVFVIVTLLAFAGGTRAESTVRIGSIVVVVGLLLYQGYDAVVYTAFQRSGIVYEDVQFIDDLAYFAMGVGSWATVAGILVGGLGFLAVILVVRWCVRAVATVGQRAPYRWAVILGHVVVWPIVGVIGPALDWGTPNLTYQASSEQVRYRTIATRAVANARASLRLESMMDSLDARPVDSTYAAYDTLSLEEPPSVYLFAVESYGSVLEEHPDLRGSYRSLMRATDSTLSRRGWDGVTARLDAPVRGGRSWLAIASLLTGVRVDRQLLFNRFQEAPDEVPHLVRFLNEQDYHTIALQPYTFARPGLPVRNLYDFDVTLYRDDLEYQGPAYGLANAPDQYSLNFAHSDVLEDVSGPFFLFFETVSSHALWNYGLAPFQRDWRSFNGADGVSGPSKALLKRRGGPPTPFLADSITAPRIFDQSRPRRYLQHVAYDLHVIREYLKEKAPAGSIAVILGDHQPPLFDTQSRLVPMHVLTTDRDVLDRLHRRGFSRGLLPDGDRVTLRQEEFYSLLVDLLAGRTAETDSFRQSFFRPGGASPSLLVP